MAKVFDNDKLDEKTLKNIKRRFAVKYHPDKAKDDNQRAEFTKIFQEINNAIEILEKTIKK
ncbi:MAG: DnaJ domain-containing protein [Candidatus Gastranaerophilaceae bacterium]